MPFVVGFGLISLGGIVIWGGVSGRFAKMAAALFPQGSNAQTTSFTANPDKSSTGFQQLNMTNGVTLAPTGGTGAAFTPATGQPSASSTGGASIPQWESSSLGSLASQGSLSGVPAIVLAGIDQAESNGQGGYINSSGYGGFFGLGVNTQYPAGTLDSAALTSTTPQGFSQQAQVAASEFASLLGQTGGDAYAAEKKYQGGSSEGTGIFSSLGIPQFLNSLSASPSNIGALV